MRSAARISVSVVGGALVVLALVGLGYTCWARMTPMFAIFHPLPVGLTSVAALLSGAGIAAMRSRFSRDPTSGLTR